MKTVAICKTCGWKRVFKRPEDAMNGWSYHGLDHNDAELPVSGEIRFARWYDFFVKKG